MAKNQKLIEDAAQAYDLIFQLIQQVAAPLLADTGLTLAQLRILFILRYRGAQSMGELARHQEIGLPTTSYHVERIVAAGLVERSQNQADRRSTFVQLTPAGVEMVNRFQRRRLDQLSAWMAELPPDDLQSLGQGLAALAQVSLAAYGLVPTVAQNESAT